MKEIVIISGKGGTGKTSICASYAWLGGKDVVVADCDVDAADMHLLLKPDYAHSEDFYSGQLAKIDLKLCNGCGECESICRFDAISSINGNFSINEIDCEGCGYCSTICPEKAIIMKDTKAGQFFISQTRINNTLVHARLDIAAENSGKLVTKVKKETQKLAKDTEIPYIIVDGSPGIGCPVIASLTGADFAVIVTEPTIAGFHDLKRVYELITNFRIKTGCIINKADLNKKMKKEIQKYLDEKKIILLAEFPYDDIFTEAITSGKTIVEYANGKIKSLIMQSWEKIKKNASLENL